MVWGVKRAGVTDLIDKIRAGNTKNMYVLQTRTISSADAISLAAALETDAVLEEFYLSGHEIDAAAIAAFANVLAKNQVLQKLAVGTSKLGDAGVTLLANGLAQNPSSGLMEWDMEYKGIGNSGAEAMGAMFAVNKNIRRVNLARNGFDGAGLDAIVSGLHASQSVQILDLHDSELTLSHTSAVSDFLCDPKCALETLFLTGNPLGDSAASLCAAIGVNTSLKKLHLDQCSLSEAALVALGDVLATNQSLEHLDLSHNQLSAASVAALSRGLQQNRTLKHIVLGQTKLTDAWALELSSSLHVTSLDVSGNALTQTSLVALVQVPSLRELRLFNNALQDGIDAVVPPLVANKTLKTLDVGANGLHEARAAALFSALHGHSSLETLEMGGNNLGDVGFTALQALQEANPRLDVAMDKGAGGGANDDN
ncbi:hypothetical protein LEN26_020684 [Aphanomyces euteiches]|nr:hypothetical protein LEN26_020684 [Aphanomyces euteiches]KAH9105957.1 hypothetical protein AeMF1_018336 [Aphanomyces euteiches]KAH9184280.1 hypothetical protein AeNC1_013742 [Aphanomyces euteiches]